MLVYFVAVGVLLVGLALRKWLQVRSFWSERGVPYQSPHPLLGSLTFLQKENPATWMRYLYDHFKSPYVGIWLFWRPALVINSPEIARRVLIKDFDVFRNKLLGSGSEKVDPIGGLNIFTVREPTWSSVRRRLTPVFTSAKLKGLHQLFSVKSKELMTRIENDLEKKNPMELRSLFTDYTTDIIGIAAFGVGSEATLTAESPIRTVTKDFMEYTPWRGLAWSSIFFFPELVNIFRFTFFPKSTVEYFRRVFKQIVAQRGGYGAASEKNDLLDALRRMKHDADVNNEAMAEDLVISQAAIFLQGGFDTSASSLTYIIYELAFLPEAQERTYQELLEAKQKNDNKDFDETVFGNLPYFNGVIKEALRKYPPLGWIDRISDRQYQIDENLTIPAGTTVYVNAVGMHYDPQLYPEPEKFIPERFLGDQDNRPFLPFSEGPRSCIGRRFAYRTIWYALAEIILKYELRPLPGAKQPRDCEIEKRGLLYTPGEPMHVQFIPRQ